MEVGDFNDSFGRINGNLIIFAEAARMVKPTESALNNPPPWKFFPLARLDFLRNVHANTKDFINIHNKSAAITRVSTEFLDRRISLERKQRWLYACYSVVDICGMHDNRKQISHDIYDYMPLSAFRFFPPSMPRSSLAAVVLTL